MIQITPQFEAIRRLCKQQPERKDIDYRLTTFCVSTDCDRGQLIYQTLTGAMFLLPYGESIDNQRGNLIEGRFLVPTDLDELKYVDQIRCVAAALNRKKYKDSFLILTTTDCNARCYYCYEKGCKHTFMSADIARDVASYLIRESGPEELKLTWFGGEPLYNLEPIDIICYELKKAGKTFRSTMATNGYYLNKEIAKHAYQAWNLKSVQITIDGTKEKYQRTKAYREHDNNAYERVLSNIQSASEAGLSVRIRMNMDGNNASDLYRLADELRERFKSCQGITGECALLQELSGKINAFESEEEAAKSCWNLHKKLRMQWPSSLPRLPREFNANSCMADNDACEVILPDGTVGRCERLDRPNIVGSIYSYEKDLKQIESWKETVRFPECDVCPFYPQCINLKQCDWVMRGCSISRRLLKRWEIEEKMISTYHQYIKDQDLKG